MNKSQNPVGLVYGSSLGGHRTAYLQFLSELFGLSIDDAAPGAATAFRLIKASRLLFSTLDDSLGLFICVSIVRSFLLRKTVGLFLSPHSCFDTSNPNYLLKRLLFKTLKMWPGVTIATITPFDIAPEYAHVSNIGLHDPQYWDKTLEGSPAIPPITALSEQLVAQARGRLIIGHVGLVSTYKGLGFLADFLEKHPDYQRHVFVACVGGIHKDESELAERLRKMDAFILGRHATDDEIESLYGVADVIWCCYPPDFDRASGVFGRALQYGVAPCIRTGSIVHKLARTIDLDVPDVAFGDHHALAKRLTELIATRQLTPLQRPDAKTRESIVGWRKTFIESISARL